MRHVPTYAALTAVLLLALLASGCGATTDAGDAASSVTRPSADEPTADSPGSSPGAGRSGGAATERPDPDARVGGTGADDDEGDAPRGEVSVDEFCATYVGVIADLSTLSGGADDQAAAGVAVMKDWVAEMDDLGTPASMPAEAAAGFDVLAGLVEDLDDDASLDDLQGADSGLSAQDEQEGTEFTDWITTHCPMTGGLAGTAG